MNGDENGAEAVAHAWAAAQAAEPRGNNPETYVARTGDASGGTGASTSSKKPAKSRQVPPPPQPPPPSSPPKDLGVVPRRRLSSYVSEPPSTLLALSVMAQEEENEKAAAAKFVPSPFDQTSQVPTDPQPEPTPVARDMAWMHASPDDINTKAKSHKQAEAGDLAGAELRQRRPGGLFKTAAAVALAAAQPPSPARKPPPKPIGPRILNHMRSLRRRDADALLEEEESDDEDDLDLKGDKDKDDAELGSDFDVDAALGPKRPFYRRRLFWSIFICSIWIISFVAAGVSLMVFKESATTSGFQAWRLCFFLAGLPVIWYIGDFVTLSIVWAVEKSMFTVKNALYFAYAVRKPMRNVIRALLALGWWALIMTVNYRGEQSSSAIKAYNIILKLWACVTIFMVGCLATTLLGKFLALKFNKESHLTKMYSALKKEAWLHRLLEPRQSYADAELDGQGGDSKDDDDSPTATGHYANFRERRRRLGMGRSATTANLRTKSERTLSTKLSGRLMFWRRASEPLPSISEESSNLEHTRAKSEDPVQYDEEAHTQHSNYRAGEIAITIDEEPMGTPRMETSSPKMGSTLNTTPEKSPEKGGKGGVKPPLPSSTLERTLSRKKGTSLPPLRVGEGPGKPPLVASPLPGRAAIDAAYAAQNRRFGVSPAKHVPPGGSLSPQSRLQRTSAGGQSATSRVKTEVGPAAAFENGPLRRDEVMTRLAKLERYIRKTALEVTFRDALNNVERSEVTSEEQAKRVGLFLFWNVKSDFDKPVITQEDLAYFLPETDVPAAFEMLDDDGDGKVTAEDCVTAVQTIFQERRNLKASLKDSRTIAASLETVVGVILHIILGFIYLILVFNISFGQIWAFVSTVILGLSFIFGSFIRQTFESTIFLFGTHPFDVGDVLFMDNDFHTVDEIQINFTVLINSGAQRVWMPTQRLMAVPFINLSNSGNRNEAIRMLVDIETPPSILDELSTALAALKEEIPNEIGNIAVSFREAMVPMKMTIHISVDLTHNGTNLGRTSRARTKIHICVAQTLRANGVSYTWPATRTPQGLVESPMPETMVEASMDAGTQKVVQFKMQ